jgi:hypothetical protein
MVLKMVVIIPSHGRRRSQLLLLRLRQRWKTSQQENGEEDAPHLAEQTATFHTLPLSLVSLNGVNANAASFYCL